MAGDWLKMEANTPDKPEVFEIAVQLGITTAETFGRLFLVWRLFDQHTEDGNAVNVSSAYLDHIAGVTGFADAMKSVHWLEGVDGEEVDGYGLRLPNFDRHNGKTAKSRALTAKRVATHKQRSGNGPLTHTALPREEKRREEVKTKEEDVVLPDWLPKSEWKAWLEVRNGLKCKNTPRALKLALVELERLKSMGFDPAKVLDQSTLKSWKSVYALKPELVSVTAEPIAKLCDYCTKVSSGTVNGRRSCDEHWSRAMANERPAKVAA